MREAELDPEGPARRWLRPSGSARRRCPRPHPYGAPCRLCGGQTVLPAQRVRAPRAPAALGPFLEAAAALEQHGVMPAGGGWTDQSAWFVQAWRAYSGFLTRLRVRAEMADARRRRNVEAAARRSRGRRR
ncbi:MAG: hypothetical protein AB7Q17_15880 [Phycisphaerae bacterium]